MFIINNNIYKLIYINISINVINTQLIDDEISINNEIKTESECLKSILNIKQNNLLNQKINLNNNFNVNPFIVQPNLQMNQPIINMNPIISNDINSFPNEEMISITFKNDSEKPIVICINPNEKISELIKRYREKSKDFDKNWFLYNGKKLEDCPHLSVSECGLINGSRIKVYRLYNQRNL